MIDAPDRHGTYVAYMLRLWQAGSHGGRPVWRASLEDPHTGERLAFGEMTELFAFLSERVGSLVVSSNAPGSEDPT